MRLSTTRPRSLHILLLIVAIATGLSCGGDNGPSKITIADYISGVTNLGATITAVRHTGDPPGVGAGGAIINVTGGTTLINGGSAQVSVSTPSGAFTDVYVVVEGVSGYYQLTLPAPVAAEDLILAMAQKVPKESFSLTYGIGSTGAVGAYQTVPVTLIQVGTGDVQVSVSWDVESDVDLHVIEPGETGEEIYYGHTQSTAGGMLDLDSNPACAIDHVKNENITWANPPSGDFDVRVDYYDACTVELTHYVVTIQRKGHEPQVVTGQLSGSGDHGAAGSGNEVVHFSYP